jgi:dienelactone hydrolase
VRLWNQRGYAAIAMDLCGRLPIPKQEKRGERHAMGGPDGWDASFQQIDWPLEDQWPYHAVADAILAHSLIRSFPEIDPDRIGVTGISWGGYLTCIVAGVDERFKFAVPVYGCGFLGEGSAWVPTLTKMGQEKAGKWLANWDPSVYLPGAKMPMLWVDGNVDFAYPLACVQKSYRLPKGQRWLSTQPGMKHSHPAGEVPPEIGVFADQILKGGVPLARCIGQGLDQRTLWATFESKSPLVKAQAVFTKDSGPWQKRQWSVEEAKLDQTTGRASFAVPDGVKAIYIAVTDERGLLASSEHLEP